MYGFHSPHKGVKVINFRSPSWFSGIAPHQCSLRPGFDSKNGNRFHRAGYILRCVSTQPALGSIPGNGNPIQVGAGATPTPDDETKIPRLPNVIVGSESIRADLSPEAWLQIQLDKLLGFDMYVASFTPLEGGRPKGASPKLGVGNRPHTTGWQPPYIYISPLLVQ